MVQAVLLGRSVSIKALRLRADISAGLDMRGSALKVTLLLALCRQAAAQDASAHEPKQNQGQGAAAAAVAEAKDAVKGVEVQRQRAKKQGWGQQQRQQGPHPLLAEEGLKPVQQQGDQSVSGEMGTESKAQPEQQGPHPLLAEEVVEDGKKPGQLQDVQLSREGQLAGEGQQAQQQQLEQPDGQQPRTLPEGVLPQQQQGPHVLLEERLTEAEEAAAAEHMQGIAAGARQDASQQQA